MENFVAYIRVSTVRQGSSGLGIDAQRIAVASYVQGRGNLVAELVEVESGRKSGKSRPELIRALAMCKAKDAVLVIGKLDRLARDVRYFLEVIDDSGVDIRFADLPDVSPSTDEGRMILVSMANFAEFEGRRIGTRTKAALAAAKARGVVLGAAGPKNLRPHLNDRRVIANDFKVTLRPVLDGLSAQGMSQRDMVQQLNLLNVKAARGGRWSLIQLQRAMTPVIGTGSKERTLP